MQAVSSSVGSERQWLLLLALALAVRLAALAIGAGGLLRDPDDYRGLAENLLTNGVLGHGETPSAYRPPLYPVLLVPCVALGEWSPKAIGVLHLALGVATVGGVYWLGLRWRLGGGALFAAVLVACDPILLNQATQVMTETLAAFLATAALIALTLACERPTVSSLAAAGACLAVAALSRPTFLAWLVCAVPVVVWPAQPAAGNPAQPAAGNTVPTWPARFRLAAAFLAAAAAVLAPWALRNQAQLGRPIVTTTHGGYTLWLGNNSMFYAFLRDGNRNGVWQATEFDAQVQKARSADEIENDRREYARARNEIGEQPAMFLQAALDRLGRFWGVMPRQVDEHEDRGKLVARFATAVWYCIEFAFAALGLWSLARCVRGNAKQDGGEGGGIQVPASPRLPVSVSFLPWLAGLLLAATFTAVHLVYWTDLRMRAPVVPFVALLAAAGAVYPLAGCASWCAIASKRRKTFGGL